MPLSVIIDLCNVFRVRWQTLPGISVYSLDEQFDMGCGWALWADGYLMPLIVRNEMFGINKVGQFSHDLWLIRQ